MKYILFIIGSSVEYFSIFILMFTLFRFRITEKLVIISIVSFMMSQVSYFTRLVPEIGALSSYIQLALLILVLWVLFRVPLFYSLIMNAAGFISGFVIQGIVILIAYLLGVSFELIQGENPWISTSVQIITVLLVLAISRMIYTLNLGFDFVPVNHRANEAIRGTNAALLVIISSSFVVAISAGLLLRGHFEEYAVIACTTFLITVPTFLYFSRKKDDEHAA